MWALCNCGLNIVHAEVFSRLEDIRKVSMMYKHPGSWSTTLYTGSAFVFSLKMMIELLLLLSACVGSGEEV